MKRCVATAIVMVGLVYSMALRELWSPQGLQKVADVALHDLSPVIVFDFFLLRSGNALRLRDTVYVLLFPLAYFAYALARGALDGWYAYHFLDPTKLSVGRFALNTIAIFFAFCIASLLLAAVANLCSRWAGAEPSSS